MTMGRYLCQGCYTIVKYGEKHPCFFYKNDDAVYSIPQQEYAEERSTSKRHAENSNDDRGNICETAEKTRNTSSALTSAHSVFSIENKDNKLSKDFRDRPSLPTAPFSAPNRKGEMDAHVRQPFKLKKDAGAEAGPSAVHPHSLGPGGKRQYICDVCQKQFKQKKCFVRHYKIHTGEKPFVCDTCGRKFSRKDNIERHLRTHTGEKPYVCDICGRSFADGGNLKKHVSTHNGGRRYTCSVCRETFGSNEDRNRHFQEKHL